MAPPSSPDRAVRLDGVRKSYEGREVLKGVTFEVGKGEFVALLGPNGAGKTTTLEILMGHRKRDGGTVTVLGEDPFRAGRHWRERIGPMPQDHAMDPYLRVGETLDLFAAFYRAPRDIDELISLVGLAGSEDRRVSKLSGGQLRRLDLAIALVGDPELLFLDEPTTGFDPAARRSAWHLLADLKSLGKSILLTTHYLEEASALADRVAVLVGGEVAAFARPDDLQTTAAPETLITFKEPQGKRLPIAVETVDGVVAIKTTEPTEVLATLTTWARTNGIRLAQLSVTPPSLEDAYLDLTRDG